MNRCIQCVNYKMLFIRYDGKCKGFPEDGFCDLKKVVISKDGCCEAWQKRKIDQDLYEQEHISLPESPDLLVIDFEELLEEILKQ